MNPALRWPHWLRVVLAAILGALAAFGLAPYGYWIITCIALASVAPLFLASATRARAAWVGWAFATGYFANALSWIIEPFQIDAERYAWMAPFALVFMAAGLALFWAFAFWLARGTREVGPRKVIVLALTLSLVEMARGYVLTGFPWAGMAQIWVDAPAGQLLAWVGPYGLGAATFLLALPLGAAVAGPRNGKAFLWPVVAVGIFAGLALVQASNRPRVAETGHIVRLVQPNAPQEQKWDPSFAPLFFARQIEFTAADPRPDLIVWPETSVPAWLGSAGPYLEAIAEAAPGTPVILGIQRGDGPRIYNSMIYLDEQGRQTGLYDKHHLVPFGEYVPLGDLMDRFGIHGMAATTGSGFSAGPGAAMLNAGKLGLALPLICYEAIFPQDVSAAPQRPDFLLQITNDAWFGTRTGPFQHLAQARMRAIEQGLPLARSANTGVSAMVDPYGNVIASLPLGQAGFVDAHLPAPLPPTLYARTGDGLTLGLLLVLLLLFGRNVRFGGA
ncbi:apolipoprotein N-acyltransferase [Ruegeria arenilitoris]|uniref:apolipoprotein N-acyltransferase n=1 Tax=Ruegeria arenilitoris TaxID=1173585 RepID=UPI00147C7859|nr:apolipoprotein N-acyltransferase [Ruegeria arenilitoris]